MRNTHHSLMGPWVPSRLVDAGPVHHPRWSGRMQRLALERRLAAGGIPTRRGRRRERAYLRRVEKKRRRLAERRPRPGVPRPPPQRASSRNWLARLGKPGRVIVLARCALASCRKPHTQRRPRFQASSRPGPTGAFSLLEGWNAYCSTRHRVRAAYERQRERTLARRAIWSPCAAPGCGRRVLRQDMRPEGGRFVPRPGRPRRFCDANCRQRAYRVDHPAYQAVSEWSPTPCRSCGGRIASTGRPGRPPTRCAACRESMSAASIVVQETMAVDQETEARRQ